MIESRHWKSDLLDLANNLEKQRVNKKWDEKSQVLFEKKIIINFFIIRKLIEAQKISDFLISKTHKLKAYPKNSKKITQLNSFAFDELYDLEKHEIKSKNINFICNQLIHSLTIFAVKENGKWNSIIMCSDYEKNKWIYEIDLKIVIDILREFGNNFSDKISFTYNDSKQDYETKIE